MNRACLTAAAVGAALLTLSSHGGAVQIDAARDAAMIDGSPNNNLGAHTHAPAGRSNGGTVRRALVHVDVAGAIPAGATITSATFEFDVSNQGGGSDDFDLHRVTTPWDEGTGTGNNGQPTGDGATWNEATGGAPWTTPGGDIAPGALGSVFVEFVGPDPETYAIGGPALVAAVQDMLDDPAGNHGFLLKAANEALLGSAVRMTTREETNPDLGAEARLVVEYVAPCPGDLDDSGAVDFTDLLAVLSNWGPCKGCAEDLDGSGDVGFADLLIVLSNWGSCP